MKIGIVGPTYTELSLPFDAQRSINMYPVFDQQGKEVASMYGCPGLASFTDTGDGPVRQLFASSNGRAFAVSSNKLFEVFSDGTNTERGTLLQSSGIVTMDENPTQLAICDGTNLYIFTYSTDTFAQVTDPDLPDVGTVVFLDGYFLCNEVGTGRFYISALNNGTSWGALDFATAESSPDPIVGISNAVGQAWLFGSQTTEIWTNTGASPFPFRRIAGAKLEVGAASAYTAVEVDNSVFWVGQDKMGTAIVYRASGFSPQRISTSPIENMLQKAGNLSNLRAYVYQEDGHVFYMISGASLETCPTYDITTGQWFEKAYLNSDGEFEQHLSCCHMFVFGKHLVGDRRNGLIYTMSNTLYSDNGDALARERTYTHLSDEDQRIRFNSLEIGFEVGVGTQTGQGADPKVSFQLSRDGARTWSDWVTKSIGKVGQYQTKVTFRRLGVAEIMTFKIRVTDPVKVAVTGSYLK